MEHFADYCAFCHANDGSGDTETGIYIRSRQIFAAPKHSGSLMAKFRLL
jgi:hypothetical protein